ncbi:MAG TPA: class I SAM-dependent methyltransferase [Chloroflexota bacterium]|nr:class I SAM-dependent methyltransferase [Chloroflexota bacterium]
MSDRYGDVANQYATTGPLRARRETHERYSERDVDLEAICRDALGLGDDESVLDVGCGYGLFLTYLRRVGHRGRLVGLDQSPGMISEAGGGVVGDAQALPFADAAFDAVSARHMLYHVPDIAAAVRELGRVAGRALVMTNAGAYMPLLNGLRADLERAFGMPEREQFARRFDDSSARGYLDAVFDRVEETRLENALVFDRPEPILRYLWSVFVGRSDAPWHELEAWLRPEVERRLEAMGGVWRDPKQVVVYGCFLHN